MQVVVVLDISRGLRNRMQNASLDTNKQRCEIFTIPSFGSKSLFAFHFGQNLETHLLMVCLALS